MRRAALTVAAVLALVLAGTVSVRAAGLIGGTLTAGGSLATLTSSSTMAVSVTMESDPAVTVTPATFELEPGSSMTMHLRGPATGTLQAHLTSLAPVNVAGDRSSATLEVRLSPPAPPPFDPRPIGGGLLILLALALLARRVRPWEIRLTRRHDT